MNYFPSLILISKLEQYLAFQKLSIRSGMWESFVKISLQKDFLKIENKELFLMVVI